MSHTLHGGIVLKVQTGQCFKDVHHQYHTKGEHSSLSDISNMLGRSKTYTEFQEIGIHYVLQEVDPFHSKNSF